MINLMGKLRYKISLRESPSRAAQECFKSNKCGYNDSL